MPPQWMNRLPGFRARAALEDAARKRKSLMEELRQVHAELKRVQTLQAGKAGADLSGGTVSLVADSMRAAEGAFSSSGRLDEVAAQCDTYREARPFPHIVIDNFTDPDLLRKVVNEFAHADRAGWHHTESRHEKKFSSEDEGGFGPFTRALVHVLNAGPFLGFLETLTGIDGLMSDPHLRGGGLHEIKRGGALGVHADFNFYKRLKVYRRLNLIIYLNDPWREEWGGHLELWEKDGKRPVVSVAPIFNRAVIFDTSNASYHGHPRPLQCPEDQSRKSLALYYYTVDYPYDEDREPHTTVFLETPA